MTMENNNYVPARCCYHCKHVVFDDYEIQMGCQLINKSPLPSLTNSESWSKWFEDNSVYSHYVCDKYDGDSPILHAYKYSNFKDFKGDIPDDSVLGSD